MSAVERALAYARQGLPVFPCSGKVPVVSGGFKAATTDEEQIRRWWEATPGANVAIPTGIDFKGKRLIVLDPDGEDGQGSLAGLEREHGELPSTRTVKTPRGQHLWFWVPFDVQIGNSAGKLGPGLDVRGVGGYVLVPGSAGYEWEGRKGELPPVAEMPGWLVELLRKPDPPPRPPLEPRTFDDGDGSAYGLRALADEAEAVRSAPEGQRNNRLNEAAFALGQLEAGGEIAPGVAEDALRQAALAAGLDQGEVEKTLRSGLEAGRQEPRRAPDDSPPPMGNSGRGASTRSADAEADGGKTTSTESAPPQPAAVADEKDEATARTPAQLAAETARRLDETERFYRRFVATGADEHCALALWTLHAHAIGAAETTGYLHLTSAERESGKTRALEVAALLVPRPMQAANVSDAALFRAVGVEHVTALIDEVDAVFGPKAREREDLRGLLNAGHRRGQYAYRMGGANKTTLERFEVFGAKMIAGIGDLPDTLASRCIRVRMERKTEAEQVEPLRVRRAEADALPLRESLAAWADASVETLSRTEPDVPRELGDRLADSWEPLVAIADLAGGGWPERARDAAVALAGRVRETSEDSIRVRLLADIASAFDRRGVDRLSTVGLIEALCEDDEAPWADWRGGPIRPRSLASLLRPFGIRSRTFRDPAGGTPKGYLREQFQSAWERYLPRISDSQAQHPPQRSNHAGLSPLDNPQHDPNVADRKTPANPHEQTDVADVADRTGKNGTEGVSGPSRRDLGGTLEALLPVGPEAVHGDAEQSDTDSRCPVVGDPGYEGWLRKMFLAGHLTEDEKQERVARHRALRPFVKAANGGPKPSADELAYARAVLMEGVS